MWMYIGTYTTEGSKGIYGAELDMKTGVIAEPRLMAETPNPGFLALANIGTRLYATLDPGTFDGKKGGGVAAFGIDPETLELTLLNEVKSGKGGNCHLDVSSDGKCIGTADYGDARIDLVPTRADGSLLPSAVSIQNTGSGPATDRQEKAHTHCATFDPTGKFLIGCDLGTDEVIVYKVDADKPTLQRNDVYHAKPGAGPRHLAFSRDRRVVYVLNELNNTIDVLRWNADAGKLSHEQTAQMLPESFAEFSKAAEVVVHPSGSFVYASNRGHDSIACFHVEPGTGHLSFYAHTPCGGKEPRHIGIEPNGKYLISANERGNNVSSFAIDHETGALKPTGSAIKLSRPVCVVFLNN